MLPTLVAALMIAGNPFSGPEHKIERPHCPKNTNSWRAIQKYLKDVEKYETKCKALGELDEEEQEWVEEQSEFFGMRAQMLMMRSWPKETVDRKNFLAAIKHRNQMPSLQGPDYIGTGWTFFGPRNLDGTTSVEDGPVTGRVNGVQYDTLNPSTFWVASASGGVFKTDDGGASFVNEHSDTWDTLYTTDIDIDPTNSNRVYVATGDYPGHWGYGLGLMRSTNGGASWTNELSTELDGCEIGDVLVEPDDTSVVLVAAGRGTNSSAGLGIWRSTDYGNSWQRQLTTFGEGYCRFAVSVKSGGIRWTYASHGSAGFIKRSADRGNTWQDASPPGVGLCSVATSTVDRDTLYCYVEDHHVFKSTNNGTDWTDITGNLGSVSGDNTDFRQENYNYVLGCINTKSDGSGSDVLVLGLVDVFALQNPTSNTTWKQINQGSTKRIVHADQHGFDVHPTVKNSALIGCDGGVWSMSYNSILGLWFFSNKNAALRITEHVESDVLPNASDNPDYCLTGMWHVGTGQCTNDPNNWISRNGSDGMFAFIDDQLPTIQYTSSQNLREGTAPLIGFEATSTAWVNSVSLTTSPAFSGENFAFVTPVAEIPGVAGGLYFAAERLYKLVWTGGAPAFTKSVGGTDLSVDPDETTTAIDAFSSPSNGCYTGSNHGRFRGSLNPATGMPVLTTFNRPISCISTHPTTDQSVLVCLGNGTDPGGSGGLWECTDVFAATPNWVDRSGSGASALPSTGVNWVARDPYSPSLAWYAATDLGVFYTDDRGAHWYSASESLGLPNALINHLVISDGYLYASTWGRGMWRMALRSTKPKVTSFTITEPEATGGDAIHGTVVLGYAAPPGGEPVSITSNDPATVPNGVVTVPQGSTSFNFAIATDQPSSDKNVTVTATANGGSDSDSVIIRAVKVIGVVAPTITGGDNFGVLVTIDRPAPLGGAVVNLATNDPTTIDLPTSVTVDRGNTAAIASCTSIPIPVDKAVGIQATRAGSGVQTSMTVLGVQVTGITLTPTSVWNTQPFTVTVTLNRAAGGTGFKVPLQSGIPSVATVPSFVTVPNNATSAQVQGSTFYTTTDTNVAITAFNWGNPIDAPLLVKHLGVSSITVSPNPIIGGNSPGGIVTVDRNVGATGVTINLSTDRPDVVNLPLSCFVLPNKTTAAYVGATAVVGTVVDATLQAQIGTQQVSGAFATTSLRVLPAVITVVPSSFTVSLGKLNSGDVNDLAKTDGHVLRICKFLVPNLVVPPVSVQVDGIAPIGSCTSLKFDFRARMQNSGSFSQQLELFNWATGTWDATDTRTDVVTTAFSTLELVGTGNLARLLKTDGSLRARYRIRETGPSAVSLWCHEADESIWSLQP